MDNAGRISKKRKFLGLASQAVTLQQELLIILAGEDKDLNLLRMPKTWTSRKQRVSDWWETSWGRLIRNPDVEDETTFWGKTFRRRFRLPFKLFKYVATICKEQQIFGNETDAAGVAAMPVELKVLGALRTLGRATLHDDVAEITGADAETHRKAFLTFIRFTSTHFFQEWISLPEGSEFEQSQKEYSMLGFPNCVGSMDATHLHWMRCPEFAKSDHSGKEGFPTRAFNVVVLHNGRIIHITRGHPGARNDKNIVRYDSFANRMRFKGLYKDLEFEIHQDDGTVIKLKGGYLISDNGYHHWSMFVCPFKLHSVMKIVRWSRWLESVRKDVECVFGRLKMRFRVLLNPIFLQKESDIDALFFTCSIFHNMLLMWDGLDVRYEDPSTWHLPGGGEEVEDDEPSPNSGFFDLIDRRSQASVDMTYVWSGAQNADNETDVEDDFYSRRLALIDHFDYLWKQKKIVWLK